MNKPGFNKFVREVLTKHMRNSNIEEANAVINVFIESMIAALRNNDEVALMGFGKFSKVKVAGREGRNPRTGELIKIPDYFKVSFTTGKELKESVNTIEVSSPKKKKAKN